MSRAEPRRTELMAMVEKPEYEVLSGVFKHATDKAALFDMGDGENVWIPLLCLDEDSVDDVKSAMRDDIMEVAVAAWFCKKEGLLP